MGFSLCSTESIALELGTAIATRMRTREGTGLYQTAVFTMSSIPRHALEQILDPELLASNTEKTAEWAATTTTEVRKLVLKADKEELNIIKAMFGSRAQTIINVLLSWDAYLAWYYALEEMDCALFDTQSKKEAAALRNCALAIDMHDMYERISVRYHKSFLVHAAIFKVSSNILDVGDVKAFSTSALELQNADTKRTASSSGSRRLTTSTSGVLRAHQKTTVGPARLTVTKGYSTSMVLSTLKHLMVTNVLRRGSGLYATPESRRKERLFGVSGKGRISLPSSGVKLEARVQAVNAEYLPSDDTCLSAFVRLLAARAEDLTGDGIYV